nr:hypothetical protein [Tanacetum cinerariifolium]
LEPVVGHHLPVRQVVVAVGPVQHIDAQVQLPFPGRLLQYPQPFRQDFLADAIARNCGDSECLAHAAPPGMNQFKPPMWKALTSRYSSRPYLLPSRPRPDCLMPPNGATSIEMIPVLRPTMPNSSASPKRHERLRSWPRREAVVDARLHEDAVGAHAGLPGVAKLADHHPGHGLFQVGVVEHHKRGVAAQLQAQALDVFGALAHQQAADGGGAGEGDLAYRRVAGEFCTDAGGHPREDVEYAGWNADALGQDRQREGRQRREVRRLDDDRATGCQRRPAFAGDHRVGEIPRGDRGADAHGLFEGQQTAVATGGRHGFAVDPARFFREPFDEAGAVADLALGLVQRLALLAGHDQREVIKIVDHRLEPALQQRCAFGCRSRAPGRPGEFGRFDGAAGIDCVHGRDLRKQVARGGVADFKGGAAVGGDPLTIYVGAFSQQAGVLQAILEHGRVLIRDRFQSRDLARRRMPKAPSNQPLAGVHLADLDKLVGLVRLLDGTRATYHHRHIEALLEQAPFGAKRDLVHAGVRRGKLFEKAHRLDGRVGVETRVDVDGFDLDGRHARKLLRLTHNHFGTLAHLLDELIQVIRRQVAHFEIQGAQVRHDVQRLAAADLPDMHCAVGHVVVGVLRAVLLQVLLALTQRRDEVAGHMNGVDRARRQGRMRLLAPAMGAVGPLALVAQYKLHVGRFADHAEKRPHRGQVQHVEQASHAHATDLLVMGQRQLQRAAE